MNQVDQNINKDMIDCDLIDVDSLDFNDDQTWLFTVPYDSGEKVDIVDWQVSCDWPPEDHEYQDLEKQLNTILDNILRSQVHTLPDKHKFDSRTYVKPKKRMTRPTIQSIVEAPSNPPSITPNHSLNTANSNKYLTYNKYSSPLGPISPMLRLKTFNVDTNTENSNIVKDYAMKRRSFVEGHDDDTQLEGQDTLAPEESGRLSMEHTLSKPINIDYSQPASNIHNTFNKGLTNILNECGSLNMYQSGESLMRMSPPSLVSSLMMESSGNFNTESLESKKSLPPHKDSGPPLNRDSIDPMLTSMTLSILDEKDMSTSFLSQTTHPDNDSLMDSLPPSLVSSVNSSYVVSKNKDSTDSNIFSSATFTHLEQSEKLLSARPRIQLFNSLKRDSLKNSESYTKSREEACQIDTSKVLNENSDKKESPKSMSETITLHYSNNKFRNEEKENFEKDDQFYKDMGIKKPEDIGRNSLNVTLGKQELNEIIQARQKLSLARKALPCEEKLPNQVDTIQLPNQIITVPRQSMENASELLARRRMNGFDKEEPTRETPKRTETFKKVSPRGLTGMDATVIYNKEENNVIDINSATLNLVEDGDRTLHEQVWDMQQRAMVGSGESSDTATFSSSSPPDSVPGPLPHSNHIASTPLLKGVKNDLLNVHSTISPIYDVIDDKSFTVTNANAERAYNATVINTATLVKRPAAKRDILAPKGSPEKKSPVKSPPRISPTHAGCPAPPPTALRGGLARTMVRRGVYASNPALSPTTSQPMDLPGGFIQQKSEEKVSRPVLTNPPALVRQGTETLRRERPPSQLVAPRDPPPSRPASIASASQLRVMRPSSGTLQRTTTVGAAVIEQPRPASSGERSALPRPSRLPAPRRALRPPSVYSVAPAADAENY